MSRRTGKWDHRVEVGDLFLRFEDEEVPFEEVRDEVVQRLNALDIDEQDFNDIVERLAYVEDETEFNDVLDDLYDWGDEDKRLWLQTF